MTRTEDLAALEALVPWSRARFRDELAEVREVAAEQSRLRAREVHLLADLAAKVPRAPGDDRGGTPWTSFQREVAVAAQVSDRAAAFRIRSAVRLTSCLPVVLAELEAGQVPVPRLEAFLRELEPYDDELAAALDRQLGARVARLSPGAVGQAVRQAAARLDAEAVAARAAVKNRDRDVTLSADADDQAVVTVYGPAVPLTRWFAGLQTRARALKAAGDPRTLAQLRHDLAVAGTPCLTHPPADSTAPSSTTTAPGTPSVPGELMTRAADGVAFGLSPGFVEPASSDCRFSRPVQANLTLPVETALGLSNEPGWLDGYGWISAPTCRLLLPDAELRRVCVQTGTGQLVHVDSGLDRPTPTTTGVRRSVLDMVLDDVVLARGPDDRPPDDDPAWAVEPDHDPSTALARFVRLRDRVCDGPTQTLVPAAHADLDHDTAWPDGPTAAWNLVARSRKTHLLKHYGWTGLRTATSTLWLSPAGQITEVEHATARPPGSDRDADGLLDPAPRLPDPDQLAAVDRDSLTPRDETNLPPWLTAPEQPQSWHDLSTGPVLTAH